MGKRCCTDIVCLLIFFVYLIVQIIIAIFATSNGQINSLLYPSDKYGQFCGLDTAVLDRPNAYYPRLDKDINEQMWILAVGPAGLINFRPTTLCVADCPPAFSISNPMTFGGPAYPGANTLAPDNDTYYNLSPTVQAYTYCLPTSETNPAMNRQLCSLPACGNVSDVCGFNPGCATVESDPEASAVAWELDRNNATQMDCCQYSVQELNTQAFLPPDASPTTMYYEQQFASYTQQAFGVFRAMSENFTQIMVMGVAAPIGFAFAWFILLFLFAGFLIVMALLLFLVALIVAAAYFYYKVTPPPYAWSPPPHSPMPRGALPSSPVPC